MQAQANEGNKDVDQEQSLMFDDNHCGPGLKVGASARDGSKDAFLLARCAVPTE